MHGTDFTNTYATLKIFTVPNTDLYQTNFIHYLFHCIHLSDIMTA